jgi:DNA-binding response OmpR family regulator
MTTLRVIVADDDPAMRGWLVAVLRRKGATIISAASGWELLSLLADEHACDLVISDVRMPLPGGLHALAMARAAGVSTPFLLITAFADDQIRGAAKSLHADLLDKPFHLRQLEARIDEILARSA